MSHFEGMPEGDLGKEIRNLRVSAGISQGELAQMAGTNQQTVQRLESGATTSSRATPKILEVLRHIQLRMGASEDDFTRAYLAEYDKNKIKKSIFNQKSSQIVQKKLFKEHDIYPSLDLEFPLYFSIEKEPGIISLDSGKSVNFALSNMLPSTGSSFAIYVPVSDMEPELEPGDILIVDRLSPPIPNVTCVFYQGTNTGSPATIKRLLISTKDEWHVKSWRPEREFSLLKSTWPLCTRVIGKFARR